MKKSIYILLAALFITVQTFAQTATAPSAGDGSSGSPYQIASLENLYWLAASDAVVSSPTQATRWSKYYIQTADIDASSTSGWDSGNGWTPIGNSTTKFTGNYNGGGFSIDNLTVNRSGSDYQGFFGYSNGATIQNLGIENINITCRQYGGGLVGWNNGTISNCYAVAVVYAGTHGGGLVGHNAGTIQKSYAVGSLRGGNRLGGLVGVQDGGAIITNSYSSVAVTDIASQNIFGGLVGENFGTITNSFANGVMTVTLNAAGGLVGRFGTATNSFWDTETTGLSISAAGTGKTTAQMKVQATFTGWDFTTIWAMDGSINDGYPYLQDVLPPTLAPATQASNITVSSIQTTQATISWTNGNGSVRAVFIKQANTGTASPADNTTYTANTAFGSGTQIGSTGWYCIYNGTGTSVTVTALTTITGYRVMVTEYNGSAGSEQYNTTTATNNPNNFTTILGVPNLSSPSDNATDISLSPTLSWSSVTGADKYHLEVNAASNFSGTVIYDQDTVSLPSKQIGGLTDNTKYYWRVTASNSSGNSSDISSVSNFTTAQAASGEVTLISPPPSTIDASTNPTISWPVTNGASKYHLEVNTASDFTGTVVIDANITSTSLPITGLNYNTTYYWRVAATSNSLSKTTTTVYSFTTKLAPPTLLSPADSTVGVSIDPTLVWSAMTNVTRYNLLMSKNPYFTTIVLQKQLPDTSYHVDTNLDQNTQYYWKVSAVNSQGNAGEYTSPGSFTTGTSALPVELTDFSANVIEDKVQLSWSTATEVNNHGFEIERITNYELTNDKTGHSSFENGHWEGIGFVAGAGNSNSPRSYSFTDKPTGGVSFSYRLKQIDVNGNYEYYDPIAVTLTTKQTIVLMQNSPNPFNPSTSIKFYIPNISDVSIKIYDMLGKEVTTLVNKQTEAGYHIVYWNGRNNYGETVSSGVYLYRLTAGSFAETKKMLMMK